MMNKRVTHLIEEVTEVFVVISIFLLLLLGVILI